MKEVIDWNIYIEKKYNFNFAFTIKKINKIKNPVIINDKKLLDNGYFIVEYTPIDKNYNAIAFLNENKDVIGYYFDISLNNGIEDNIPFYVDLYLDIICNNHCDYVETLDQNELEEAYNNGEITKDVYNIAIKVEKELK